MTEDNLSGTPEPMSDGVRQHDAPAPAPAVPEADQTFPSQATPPEAVAADSAEPPFSSAADGSRELAPPQETVVETLADSIHQPDDLPPSGDPHSHVNGALGAGASSEVAAEVTPEGTAASPVSSREYGSGEFSEATLPEYGEAALPKTDEESAASDTLVAVAEGSYVQTGLDEVPAGVMEMPGEDRPRSTLAEWTITILLLLFLTTTLVQAYVIPTGSMEDTLLIGDHLLVDKLAFAPPGPISRWILPYTEVTRGDIIVFRYPVDISQTFVKRAIGVPGDHIRIINKEVYLNGVKLNEPYTYHKTPYIDSYRDNFPGEPNGTVEQGAFDMLANNVVNGEVVVPPNHYFALGDNRDSSLDSRFWGFVPRENIIGKPLIIYWSYDAPTEDLNTSSVSLRHVVDLGRNFFAKTRWNRTFQLIHGYPLK